mmetsp:Transcript_8253/g.17941  ORF Transcript_8253/g.17941 Transcript_8253/m.17941 type:complete len:292 (-) Transcript_8253:349-1224(-)
MNYRELAAIVLVAAASLWGCALQHQLVKTVEKKVTMLEKSVAQYHDDLRESTEQRRLEDVAACSASETFSAKVPFTKDDNDWWVAESGAMFLFPRGIVVGQRNDDCVYGDGVLSVDHGDTNNGHNCPAGNGAVTFGYASTASGDSSSVLGGFKNTASGIRSSVSGGRSNHATAKYSSVAAGAQNMATGDDSSVSGGYNNLASAASSSVASGVSNAAQGLYSSVAGGRNNLATGKSSSVVAGFKNEAQEEYSSVSGGSSNLAADKYSTVTGGFANKATGLYSSVSCGKNNEY